MRITLEFNGEEACFAWGAQLRDSTGAVTYDAGGATQTEALCGLILTLGEELAETLQNLEKLEELYNPGDHR